MGLLSAAVRARVAAARREGCSCENVPGLGIMGDLRGGTKRADSKCGALNDAWVTANTYGSVPVFVSHTQATAAAAAAAAEAAVAAAAAAAEATTGKEAVEEAGSARGRERKTDNGTGRR